MNNALLDEVEYQVEETRLGVWRRFRYPTGELFEEFVSHGKLFGLPLVHYTRGRCPETGKRITARGIVAVGRFAFGVIAIGQVSVGLIAIGQLALGVLLGFGQASIGLAAVGQLAIGGAFGLGQAVTGFAAIGQLGLGTYVLAQFGIGEHVWDMRGASPVAQEFFRSLVP